MARRAIIGFRGPVIAHRKASRNLINGLHREVINLIKAQLPGFVLLVHARSLPHWTSVPSETVLERAHRIWHHRRASATHEDTIPQISRLNLKGGSGIVERSGRFEHPRRAHAPHSLCNAVRL